MTAVSAVGGLHRARAYSIRGDGGTGSRFSGEADGGASNTSASSTSYSGGARSLVGQYGGYGGRGVNDDAGADSTLMNAVPGSST